MSGHVSEPNDPTRSGAPLPTGEGAYLSRNEVEALCQKAARGAGMSWGMAEEAGFAAGWLAGRGLKGPDAMLAHLSADGGRPWPELTPTVQDGAFKGAEGGNLCPVALGAALCDYAALPQTAMGRAPLQLGSVLFPILLVPFLAELARLQGHGVQMSWPNGEVSVSVEGALSGQLGELTQEACGPVALTTTRGEAGGDTKTKGPLFVASATISGLSDLALRTTVPASEASRAGAGSMLSDND